MACCQDDDLDEDILLQGSDDGDVSTIEDMIDEVTCDISADTVVVAAAAANDGAR